MAMGGNIFAGILENLGKVLGTYGVSSLEKQQKLELEKNKVPEEIKLWNATHPSGETPTWEDLTSYRAAASPYYTGKLGEKLKVPTEYAPRQPTTYELERQDFGAASGRIQRALQNGQPIDPTDKAIVNRFRRIKEY